MTGKPKHLSLRIDEDLLRKFEYVAKYDDRSMNWYLLHLIKNEIADFEEKNTVKSPPPPTVKQNNRN